MPPFSVASPVSATAVGVVLAAELGEHHIGPVVGGTVGVGRENAGGGGSAIGVDAVATGVVVEGAVSGPLVTAVVKKLLVAT